MSTQLLALLAVAVVAAGVLLRRAAWAGWSLAGSRVAPLLVAACVALAHHLGRPLRAASADARQSSDSEWLLWAAGAWICVTLGLRLQTTGLTGSIAVGKTSVANELAARGATLVDADALARAAVAPGTLSLWLLVWGLGGGILAADATLDRRALRNRIARDPASRAFVNAVVHPSVAARLLAAVAWHRWVCGRAVVLDVPLLFETGGPAMRALVWPVVVVTAPEGTQLARLLARDYAAATAGADAAAAAEAEARALIAAQMPQGAKAARGDVVVRNDGSPAQLAGAVGELWSARLARLP